MILFAQVVLPVPLRKSFVYRVPEEYQKKVRKGIRVLVPFRKNLLTGFITELFSEAPLKNIKFKKIRELLDEEPVFSLSFLSFTKRLSDYYYSSWGEILHASLPPSFAVKTRTVIYICKKGKAYLNQDSCSDSEREILKFLTRKHYTELYLRRKFKKSSFSSIISNMEEKGLISIKKEIRRSPKREWNNTQKAPTQIEIDDSLDSDLRKKADEIKSKRGEDAFSCFLISSSKKKREAVYFDLIRETTASGLKTLFLFPEIELSDRILKEFKKKLGENAAVLHSRMSEKQKELTWERIRRGEAEVVAGPRSVLLTPFEKLGLIILDQEHEDSYYQKESPAYDARIGARLRAEEEKAVLIYGSEYPSVELLYRSRNKGSLIDLDKVQKTQFKRDIIDSRKQTGVISRAMKTGIMKRVEQKEPVTLFFNRHGYASSLVCSQCDFTPKCQNCEVLLTYYKKEEKLICRYCHYSTDLFMKCPECGSRMVPGGGFGIEVLEEELKRNFPDSCIRSLHKLAVKKKNQEEEIIKDYRAGKIDILLGTQMMAHQSKLPLSYFVGVFYPESILRLSDFRAGYKTFRYIKETMKFVKDAPNSEFMVQTYLPHTYPIQNAVYDDSVSFYEHELRNRRLMGYPPFSYLAELLFTGKDLRSVARKSRKLLDVVKDKKDQIEILGPSFAPVKKLRGKNRVQVIIKSKERSSLDEILEKIFKDIKTRKSVFVYE